MLRSFSHCISLVFVLFSVDSLSCLVCHGHALCCQVFVDVYCVACGGLSVGRIPKKTSSRVALLLKRTMIGHFQLWAYVAALFRLGDIDLCHAHLLLDCANHKFVCAFAC